MNLTKLYEMQMGLDNRIKQEKKLFNVDTLPDKLTALFVELGECANEWRGFKFWSEDKKARDFVFCPDCKGAGAYKSYRNISKQHTEMYNKKCDNCKRTGVIRPLLIEFVDCLHFILSIGVDINAQNVKIESDKMDDISSQFRKVFTSVALLSIDVETKEKEQYMQEDFQELFNNFVGLGEMLGFTWAEIEVAYYEKNAVNHERQNNGY